MNFNSRVRSAIHRLPRPKRHWLWAILLIAIPASGLVLSIVFWDWLSHEESRGTTIRNIGLIMAGVTALPLAIWRGLVAEKQAEAAQQSLRNERYQKGAEMLGSELMSVRLAGIYALQRLAREHSEEYHIQIMGVFGAFLRNPTRENDIRIEAHIQNRVASEDIQAIVSAIVERDEEVIALEKSNAFKLNLNGADLSGVFFAGGDLSNITAANANLSRAIFYETALANAVILDANLTESVFLGKVNLSGVRLFRVNLRRAIVSGGDLSGADIIESDMSDARLWQVDLTGSRVLNTNLSGTDLGGHYNQPNVETLLGLITELLAKGETSESEVAAMFVPKPVNGLTQTQLDQALAEPSNGPLIAGVLDAETGRQLEWRGKPLKDDT